MPVPVPPANFRPWEGTEGWSWWKAVPQCEHHQQVYQRTILVPHRPEWDCPQRKSSWLWYPTIHFFAIFHDSVGPTVLATSLTLLVYNLKGDAEASCIAMAIVNLRVVQSVYCAVNSLTLLVIHMVELGLLLGTTCMMMLLDTTHAHHRWITSARVGKFEQPDGETLLSASFPSTEILPKQTARQGAYNITCTTCDIAE